MKRSILPRIGDLRLITPMVVQTTPGPEAFVEHDREQLRSQL